MKKILLISLCLACTWACADKSLEKRAAEFRIETQNHAETMDVEQWNACGMTLLELESELLDSLICVTTDTVFDDKEQYRLRQVGEQMKKVSKLVRKRKFEPTEEFRRRTDLHYGRTMEYLTEMAGKLTSTDFDRFVDIVLFADDYVHKGVEKAYSMKMRLEAREAAAAESAAEAESLE